MSESDPFAPFEALGFRDHDDVEDVVVHPDTPTEYIDVKGRGDKEHFTVYTVLDDGSVIYTTNLKRRFLARQRNEDSRGSGIYRQMRPGTEPVELLEAHRKRVEEIAAARGSSPADHGDARVILAVDDRLERSRDRAVLVGRMLLFGVPITIFLIQFFFMSRLENWMRLVTFVAMAVWILWFANFGAVLMLRLPLTKRRPLKQMLKA